MSNKKYLTEWMTDGLVFVEHFSYSLQDKDKATTKLRLKKVANINIKI